MTVTNLLERKAGDLKTWELYFGFVILQILIGVFVYVVISFFDLLGIHGTVGALVRQFGVVTQAQPLQKWAGPIASEVRQGNII
jgi:hypothetical protein